MGDEFISEDGGVGFNFDDVDGDGGDFREDGAAEGVGKGEVYGAEAEVDSVGFGLVFLVFLVRSFSSSFLLLLILLLFVSLPL